MSPVVVAFENESQRDKIAGALQAGGCLVKCACASGAEAVRLARKLDRLVIVCGHKLCDQTADDLAHAIGGATPILVVAPKPQLELLAHPSLFRLPHPVSRGELLASVRMLEQLALQQASPPSRSASDRETIAEAKARLMRERHMDEDEAHRFLQHASMTTGKKLVDIARTLIAQSSASA